MEEQTLKSTGNQAPYSHQSGRTPIVGTFATPGIQCENSYLSPHNTGVGDHRFQLHDFSAASVIGTEYNETVKPTGRSLRCTNVKARKKYTKRLKKLCTKHKVYDKLDYLTTNKNTLPRFTFEKKFNKWDTELVQFQLGAENGCNQFFNGTIEFNPLVGIYVWMIRLYKWIERFQPGRRVNKKSLWRMCKRKKSPKTVIPNESGGVGEDKRLHHET